jgi:hypothetical protein
MIVFAIALVASSSWLIVNKLWQSLHQQTNAKNKWFDTEAVSVRKPCVYRLCLESAWDEAATKAVLPV